MGFFFFFQVGPVNTHKLALLTQSWGLSFQQPPYCLLEFLPFIFLQEVRLHFILSLNI